MLKRSLMTVLLILPITVSAAAQDASSSSPSTPSTRTRTVAPQASPTPAKTTTKPASRASPAATQTGVEKPKASASPATPSPSQPVLDAFNSLLDGIRHADVKAVTNAYQNSKGLILFNNNGTVTRGWEQLKLNREASYPKVKDVKLEVKDLAVTMLARDSALITCQWTQSQTYDGAPESATGRMTIVFKRIAGQWKAIHLHTSPDKPDPSRVMPSEQATPPE